MKKLLALSIVLFSFIVSPTQAKEFLVTSPNNDGPGTLAFAIHTANNNDDSKNTITFDSNIQTITLSNNLPAIKKNLTIKSEDNLVTVTIDGDRELSIFSLDPDTPLTLTLKKLKIINGFSKEAGGAVKGFEDHTINIETNQNPTEALFQVIVARSLSWIALFPETK